MNQRDHTPLDTGRRLRSQLGMARNCILELRDQVGTLLFFQSAGPDALGHLHAAADLLKQLEDEWLGDYVSSSHRASANVFAAMITGVAIGGDSETAKAMIPFVNAQNESVGFGTIDFPDQPDEDGFA